MQRAPDVHTVEAKAVESRFASRARFLMVGFSIILAVIAVESARGRQSPVIPKPVIHASIGLVTIGDGVNSHGLFDITDFLLNQQPDTAQALDFAFNRASRVVFLAGTFPFQRPFQSSRSSITIEADPAARFVPSNSKAVSLFDLTGNDVSIAGIHLDVTQAIPSQTAIRFTGKNTAVRNCKFEVSTANGNAAQPMVVLKFEGAVRKSVTGNLWLPNAGVVCLQSIDGNGLQFIGNEISNGVDGGFPEGFSTRSCFRGIDLVREEWSTLTSNKFFGLGLPSVDKVESILRYQGDATTEAGHIVIASNLFEAIASDHMIWLRGCQWFDISSNIIGPATSFPDQAGEAALTIVGENGADGGQPSGGGIICGNDIHNSAESGSDGSAIYLEAAGCVSITSNNFEYQREKYVVRVDSNTCPQLTVQNNRFMGYAASGNTPISPLFFSNEAANGIVVGQNAFSGFIGGIITGNPSGAKVFLAGLMDTTTKAPPTGSTLIQNLTTNVKTSP